MSPWTRNDKIRAVTEAILGLRTNCLTCELEHLSRGARRRLPVGLDEMSVADMKRFINRMSLEERAQIGFELTTFLGNKAVMVSFCPPQHNCAFVQKMDIGTEKRLSPLVDVDASILDAGVVCVDTLIKSHIDMLELISKGLSNKEIARIMEVHVGSVTNQMTLVYAHIGVSHFPRGQKRNVAMQIWKQYIEVRDKSNKE
mgnify:CR=1 FL=1